MENKPKQYKHRFVGSSYMMIMCALLILLSTGVMVWLTYNQISKYGFDDVTVALFCMPLLIVIPCYINRFEYFPVITIKGDSLEIRALLSKRRMYYEDICYIGIDYAVLEGQKRFWIYFSKEPVPINYLRHVKLLRSSKKTLWIQFSDELFDSLRHYLPDKLSRELGKHYSIIRACRAENQE